MRAWSGLDGAMHCHSCCTFGQWSQLAVVAVAIEDPSAEAQRSISEPHRGGDDECDDGAPVDLSQMENDCSWLAGISLYV